MESAKHSLFTLGIVPANKQFSVNSLLLQSTTAFPKHKQFWIENNPF